MNTEQALSLLFTQTWQVAVVALVVWLAVRLFAKQRPHLAHALWALVLIKCLTPPIWSSPVSPFSWMPNGEQTVATVEQQSPKPTLELKSSPTTPDVVVFVDRANQKTTSGKSLDNEALIPVGAYNKSENTRPIWTSYLVSAWLMGAIVALTISVIRLACFISWLKSQPVVKSEQVQRIVDELRTKLGIRRHVRVSVLCGPVGPAVIGLLRPTIVLPYSILNEKSDDEIRPLVAHELIHIRRGDLWWALVQTFAKCLFWFHPLVWIAVKMVTRESERSCDEETVACLGCSPTSYARRLLEVLEHKHQLRIAPAIPGVRPVDITSARLERVMRFGNGIHKRAPFWVWLIAFAFAAILLPGSAAVVGQQAVADPQEVITQSEVVPQPLPGPGAKLPSRNHRLPDWELVCYPVGDLVRDLKEQGMTGESLLVLLSCRYPGKDGSSSTPNGLEIQSVISSREQVTLGGDHPTMKLLGSKLCVFAPKAEHKGIEKSLAKYREFGFKNIVIETRFLTGPSEQLDRLGIVWHLDAQTIQTGQPTTKTAAGNSGKGPSEWTPEQITQSLVQTAGPDGFDASKIQSIVGAERYAARATSFVTQEGPVRCASLSDKEVFDVVQILKGHVATNIVQAPTVTMFNGQTASIVDGSMRPFVVGVKREKDAAGNLQPVVKVEMEGTRVNVTASNIEDTVQLDCKLEFSLVKDVDEVEVMANGNGPVTIQMPTVAATQIHSSMDIPDGHTLALRTYRENREGETEDIIVMLTCRVIDAHLLKQTTPVRMKSEPSPIPSDPANAQYRFNNKTKVENAATSSNENHVPESHHRFSIRAAEMGSDETSAQDISNSLASLGIDLELVGDLQYAENDNGIALRGKDVTFKSDIVGQLDGFYLSGQEAEILVSDRHEFEMNFAGNGIFTCTSLNASADRIQYEEGMLMLDGNASVVHNGAELAAKNIVVHFEGILPRRIDLRGEARLQRMTEDESPIDIRAHKIHWSPRSGAIGAYDQ